MPHHWNEKYAEGVIKPLTSYGSHSRYSRVQLEVGLSVFATKGIARQVKEKNSKRLRRDAIPATAQCEALGVTI